MDDDRRDADYERDTADRLQARRAHPEEGAQDQRDDEPDEVVRDEPAVHERARSHYDRGRERRTEREAPAGEQRCEDDDGGQDVEPQGALRPVRDGMPTHDRAGDSPADPGQD